MARYTKVLKSLAHNAVGDRRIQAAAPAGNNYYVTGATLGGAPNYRLTLARNGGLSDVTVDLDALSPGGSDTQVQFNDGGSFGGDAGLTYNKTTDSLVLGGSLYITEKAAAGTDTAGLGQLWVKNEAPTELYFTNDDGEDIQITFTDHLAPTELIRLQVRNDEGSTIPAGAPLYSKGEIGGSQRIRVGIADASDSNKMPCIGIAYEEMNTTSTQDNFAVLTGVYNTNITITSVTEQDTIYVAPHGGSTPYLTVTKPTSASHLIQNVGICIRQTAANTCASMYVSSIGRTNDVPNSFDIVGPITTDSFVMGGITTNDILISSDASSTSDTALVTAGYVDAHAVQGDINGSITDNQIAFGASTANSIEGSANLTFDGTTLTYTSTDAGNAAGPELDLFRNSASPAAADYIGQVRFLGESSTGVQRTYAKITGKIGDPTNAAEDGIIEMMTRKGGSNNIAVRLNESEFKIMNDTDFSVDTNTLYVDSTNNRVGIGTSSPTDKLNINTGAGTFDFRDYNLTYSTSLGIRAEAGYLGLVAEAANDVFISTNGFSNKRLVVKDTGKVGIGTTSPAELFNVESASNTLALFKSTDNRGLIQVADDDTTASIVAENSTLSLGLTSQISTSNININSSGKLGIGTTSPSYPLHINGAATQEVRVQSSDSGAYSRIQLRSATDGYAQFNMGDSGVDAAGGLVYTHSTDTLNIRAANSNIMNVTSAGVGIGTTAPAQSLDVITGDGIAVRRENTDSAIYGPSIYVQRKRATGGDLSSGDLIGNLTFQPYKGDYDNRAATISAAVEGTVGTDITPGRLMFSTAAAGANTVTERMRIDSAGNVGIGTTSPSYKLDVVGTTQLSGAATINGTTTINGGQLKVTDGGASSPLVSIAADDANPWAFHIGNDTYSTAKASGTQMYQGNTGIMNIYHKDIKRMQFQVNGDSSLGTATNVGLYVQSGGNVGIGTSAPSYPLHVAQGTATYGIYMPNSNSRGIRFGDTSNNGTGYGRIEGIGGSLFLGSTQVYTSFIPIADVNATLGSVSRRWSYFFTRFGQVGYDTSTTSTAQFGISGASDKVPLEVYANGATAPAIHVTSGSLVGVGLDTPTSDLHIKGELDIQSGNQTILMGAGNSSTARSNDTLKLARVGLAHYHNAEEPVAMLYAASNGTDNTVVMGGGTSNMNAATKLQFATATDDATTAGTNRMTITGSNVGIGTTSPQQPLHVLTSANDKGILIDVSDDSHEGRLIFGDTSSNGIGHIGYNHGLNAMRFFTNGAESLRLESDQDANFYGDVSTLDSHKLKVVNASSDYWAMYNQSNGKMRIDQGTTQRVLASSGEFQFANDIIVDGNVGIGTTSPSTKLHVVGNGLFDGNNTIIGASDVSQNTYLKVLGSGAGYTAAGIKLLTYNGVDRPGGVYSYADAGTQAWYSGPVYGSSYKWGVNYKSSIANTGSGLELVADDAYNLFMIDKTGKVGIGTTSPQRKLHVMKASAGSPGYGTYANMILESDDHNYLQFSSPSNKIQGITFGDGNDNAGAIYYDHATDYMRFFAGASERVRIDSAGNVGIGTTSPSQKLDVVGAAQIGTLMVTGSTLAVQREMKNDITTDTTLSDSYSSYQAIADGGSVPTVTLTAPSSPSVGDEYVIVGTCIHFPGPPSTNATVRIVANTGQTINGVNTNIQINTSSSGQTYAIARLICIDTGTWVMEVSSCPVA